VRRNSRSGVVIIGIVVAAALVAGCGKSEPASSSRPATDAPTSKSTQDSVGGAPLPSTAVPVELAAWQEIEITDAGGETFRIGDLVGRPVFVENFATWCGNCRRQLRDTQKAASTAGGGAVFVALSVETELERSDMVDYSKEHGFSDIRFAVMSPELLGAMYDAYGNSALNPPSTPKIVVAPEGRAGELVTGFESPEEILSKLGLS
jgi:thiol-disulfide isomerase/thioredoxin